VDLRRLRAGEWLAGAGGVLLLVSLALPWYQADGGDVSGYEAFSIVDILLVVVAAVAIALALLQATRTTQALPVAFGVLTVTVGVIGTLLTLYRLIDDPGEVSGPRLGAWLGLVAVAALTAGGWMSLANEHVSNIPPGPEPELRPAPRG
jgi:hypothetical protein